ncbi:MAG: hypothetical protein R3C59_16580 [Planctomycetaceae bacterium]
MTGYTVHTGASKKFVSGWDRIFSADANKKKTSDKKKKSTKASGKKNDK